MPTMALKAGEQKTRPVWTPRANQLDAEFRRGNAASYYMPIVVEITNIPCKTAFDDSQVSLEDLCS